MPLLHSGTQRNHKDFSSDVPSNAVFPVASDAKLFRKIMVVVVFGPSLKQFSTCRESWAAANGGVTRWGLKGCLAAPSEPGNLKSAVFRPFSAFFAPFRSWSEEHDWKSKKLAQDRKAFVCIEGKEGF